MSAVVSPDSAASEIVALSNGLDHRAGRMRALRTILLAGAAAATLDLMFAFAFYGATVGASPVRILQSIASGAYGMASFNGGIATALFGLVAHYGILIVAASFYYAASLFLLALRRHAVPCGLLFGIAIYWVMHYVVLPLSAAPKFRTTTLSATSEFLMHLVLGLTIALIVRSVSVRVSNVGRPRRPAIADATRNHTAAQ